tara:strand:+ start:9176 stop:10846 length:1671 start_codon:yes stop_codon:yes gene_type:complete
MVVPNINWSALEEEAKNDVELQNAINVIFSKTPEQSEPVAFSGSTNQQTVGEYSRQRFAESLLTRLGADPNNSGNVDTLVRWMAMEGTGAGFNPLAIALDKKSNSSAGFWNDLNNQEGGWVASESTVYGVRNFSNFDEGVEETAKFLERGYSRMIEEFRDGTTPEKFSSSVSDLLLAWSGDGYDNVMGGSYTPDVNVGQTQGTFYGESSLGGALSQAGLYQERSQGFLEEQFGAIGFFVDENQDDLLIGQDRFGNYVPWNDPTATGEPINILDAILADGPFAQTEIAGDTAQGELRIRQLLTFTKWGQENTKHQKEFDVEFSELNDVEKKEYLETAITEIENTLQFLGLTSIDVDTNQLLYGFSEDEIFDLAYKVERLNKTGDRGFINGLVLAHIDEKDVVNDYNLFEGQVEKNKADAANYFIKVNDETARRWAEDMFVGNTNEQEYLQFLKHKAWAEFPHLKEPLLELGMTPKEYFQSTETAIEDLLGKQVNLADPKWSPIINHVDPTGSVRALTRWEAENYVRGTDDYLSSNRGQNKIYQLVEGIASAFGKASY